MNNYSLINPKNDEFMTPLSAWRDISHIIPRDKIIWEAFHGDGTSAQHLIELGFVVVSFPGEDFFSVQHGHGDIIVTNPPFSKKLAVMRHLKTLGKPFIVILPAGVVHTRYMQDLYNNELQVIVPYRRIQFQRDGLDQGRCNFECFYFCWKMNLPRDLLFLNRQ
jgi:hypothetical protein